MRRGSACCPMPRADREAHSSQERTLPPGCSFIDLGTFAIFDERIMRTMGCPCSVSLMRCFVIFIEVVLGFCKVLHLARPPSHRSSRTIYASETCCCMAPWSMLQSGKDRQTNCRIPTNEESKASGGPLRLEGGGHHGWRHLRFVVQPLYMHTDEVASPTPTVTATMTFVLGLRCFACDTVHELSTVETSCSTWVLKVRVAVRERAY